MLICGIRRIFLVQFFGLWRTIKLTAWICNVKRYQYVIDQKQAVLTTNAGPKASIFVLISRSTPHEKTANDRLSKLQSHRDPVLDNITQKICCTGSISDQYWQALAEYLATIYLPDHCVPALAQNRTGATCLLEFKSGKPGPSQESPRAA